MQIITPTPENPMPRMTLFKRRINHDEILKNDGTVKILLPGIDFDGRPEDARNSIYQTARRRGLKVRINIYTDFDRETRQQIRGLVVCVNSPETADPGSGTVPPEANPTNSEE